jgi:hypothetical protein
LFATLLLLLLLLLPSSCNSASRPQQRTRQCSMLDTTPSSSRNRAASLSLASSLSLAR